MKGATKRNYIDITKLLLAHNFSKQRHPKAKAIHYKPLPMMELLLLSNSHPEKPLADSCANAGLAPGSRTSMSPILYASWTLSSTIGSPAPAALRFEEMDLLLRREAAKHDNTGTPSRQYLPCRIHHDKGQPSGKRSRTVDVGVYTQLLNCRQRCLLDPFRFGIVIREMILCNGRIIYKYTCGGVHQWEEYIAPWSRLKIYGDRVGWRKYGGSI